MRTVTVGTHQFNLPFVDLIPYDDDQFADLTDSIRLAGAVTVPVVCWKEKKESHTDVVIDGAHRAIVAELLGLDSLPRIYRSYETEEEAQAACESLNYDRRQVPEPVIVERRLKRRGHVLEKRLEGKSLRTIAEEVNVSKTTVINDLAESGGQGCPPDAKPPIVTGKDGKTYPAVKPLKLCQRCQRVGATPDCEGCQEANKPVQTRPVPNGKPREPKQSDNGAEHFNIRAFEDLLGKASAMLDRLAKQHGFYEDRSKKGQVYTPIVMQPAHKSIVDHIQLALAATKEWVGELSRAQA